MAAYVVNKRGVVHQVDDTLAEELLVSSRGYRRATAAERRAWWTDQGLEAPKKEPDPEPASEPAGEA